MPDRCGALDVASLTPLPREFYCRPVLTVARACIGTLLVHRSEEGIAVGRIVETEAYRGPEDRAAHSAGGRRTRRTEAMYGPPGHSYMFRLYGVHWAFNVVVAQPERPHAVLVRAVEPLPPLDLWSQRRGGMDAGRRELSNGPGKLCAALGLNGEHYGMDLCTDRLFLASGWRSRVGRSKRINIDYAGS